MSVPLIAGFSLAEVQTPGLDESFFLLCGHGARSQAKIPGAILLKRQYRINEL